MTPRGKSLAKQVEERLSRAGASISADTDGIRLYNMAKELKITPVQAVVRYFCHGKGHYKVKRDYEGLLKIVSLLNECDWEYDPAVKVNPGDDIRDPKNRWVIWDRDRPGLTTTEIRCQEDVVEGFLKPLLGETFNVAAFLKRLVEQGPTPEAVEEVQQAIKLRKHGRPKKGEERKGADGTLKRGENSAAYIRARLQRDHPELIEALDRGEFRSARAAAIEAGIIKPVPTVRLVRDPPKVAAAIAKHFTPSELQSLCEALLSHIPSEQ